MDSNTEQLDGKAAERSVGVIIPTRNESANVTELVARVREALGDENWSLVFVDDSDDNTPAIIREAAAADTRVRLVHRPRGERIGGLGGAVSRGFQETNADIMVVMDGDLQHPPEAVPKLVAAFNSADVSIAVASRYTSTGSAAGLESEFRRLASKSCQKLAYLALRRSRATSDPMSGFFAVRREVVSGIEFAADGFKILLEILIRCPWERCADVPYTFALRNAGESKSSFAEARKYLKLVRALSRGQAAENVSRRDVAIENVAKRPITEDSEHLRIMIFTSESAPVVSGISTCVNNLERVLGARGHAVAVVSRADFPRLMHSELRLSAFIFHWPRFRRQLSAFDVINVHGPVPTMSEILLLLSRTLRKHDRPTIVYTHHSDLAIPGLGPMCWIYNQLTSRLAKMADAVLVSSEGYAQKFAGLGDTPVEVIPWAVDTADKVRPRVDVAHDRLRVLFVGQLRRYKGVHLLLKAVADLPNVELTVIGDGPERLSLEGIAGEMPLGNVTFRGRVSDGELWQAYSEHDVVTLPSLTSAEAYGLVLAEGMAAGCVPVASDLPGVREVAGPTGVLVAPGDHEALSKALADLASDRATLNRLARESTLRAEGLSLHATGERHEEVFRRALERRGRLQRRVVAA